MLSIEILHDIVLDMGMHPSTATGTGICLRCNVNDTRYKLQGTGYWVPGARCYVLGADCEVFGARGWC